MSAGVESGPPTKKNVPKSSLQKPFFCKHSTFFWVALPWIGLAQPNPCKINVNQTGPEYDLLHRASIAPMKIQGEYRFPWQILLTYSEEENSPVVVYQLGGNCKPHGCMKIIPNPHRYKNTALWHLLRNPPEWKFVGTRWKAPGLSWCFHYL